MICCKYQMINICENDSADQPFFNNPGMICFIYEQHVSINALYPFMAKLFIVYLKKLVQIVLLIYLLHVAIAMLAWVKDLSCAEKS